MMSLEAIKALSREHALEAAALDKQPFTYFRPDEVDEFNGFPFPFIGDYEPPGWVEVDRHFVDSSGWGVEGEPALTVGQFRQLILDRIAEHPATGWAVVEAGPFQVYVAEYHREPRGGAA